MGGLWWVAVLAVVGVLVPPAMPCSCLNRHPQQHVCEADFVVMARVRRVTETLDGLTAYKVRIKRLLKASEKVQLILQKGLIYTIPGTCESELESRTSYVITGNVEASKPWTNICHFVKPWKSLSPKMKKGFRLLYQSGCDCPIMSCHFWQSCPKASFFCAWETSTEMDDCQGRHAVCLRGPDGTCGWLGGRLYRTCMKARGNRPGGANSTVIYNNNSDQENNDHDNRINAENDSLPPRRGKLSRFGYKRAGGRAAGVGAGGAGGGPAFRRRRPLRRRPQRPHQAITRIGYGIKHA